MSALLAAAALLAGPAVSQECVRDMSIVQRFEALAARGNYPLEAPPEDPRLLIKAHLDEWAEAAEPDGQGLFYRVYDAVRGGMNFWDDSAAAGFSAMGQCAQVQAHSRRGAFYLERHRLEYALRPDVLRELERHELEENLRLPGLMAGRPQFSGAPRPTEAEIRAQSARNHQAYIREIHARRQALAEMVLSQCRVRLEGLTAEGGRDYRVLRRFCDPPGFRDPSRPPNS